LAFLFFSFFWRKERGGKKKKGGKGRECLTRQDGHEILDDERNEVLFLGLGAGFAAAGTQGQLDKDNLVEKTSREVQKVL
jgi:hypothetical protein